jgi:hypothetical protein
MPPEVNRKRPPLKYCPPSAEVIMDDAAKDGGRQPKKGN